MDTQAEMQPSDTEASVEALTRRLQCLQDDFERAERTIEELRAEVACPACGCATVADADSSECGCDSAVCSRRGPLVVECLRLIDMLKRFARRGEQIWDDDNFRDTYQTIPSGDLVDCRNLLREFGITEFDD